MYSIDGIISRVEEYRQKFLPNADSELVQRLMAAGENIITEAYDTKDTNNVRYNQHDAYGYAVYYDGSEIQGTRGYLGAALSKKPVKLKGELWYGREAVDKWLTAYKAPSGNVVTLAAVNAMFYSEIQEKGAYTLKRVYKILSQTFDQFEELKNTLETEYNVTIVTA